MNRFQQKISRYDAAIDDDENEGGVELNFVDPEEDADAVREVNFKAIEPEIPQESLNLPQHPGPYPPLPSTKKVSVDSELSSNLGKMSIGGASDAIAPSTPGRKTKAPSATRQAKPWESGRTASALFPGAKSTQTPSEFFIKCHDDEMALTYGINIMNTRFWDPYSVDWNPERFLDTVTQKYSCPFTCE